MRLHVQVSDSAYFNVISFKALCRFELTNNRREQFRNYQSSRVVSVSIQTWFIRYIYHRKLQILDNVIIIKLRSISLRHKKS